jgi:uncharacterized protein YbjT (DUF2867 family)
MKPLILVTGATGYVGGQLLKALLAAGHRVRCLARRPEVLQAHGLAGAEVVRDVNATLVVWMAGRDFRRTAVSGEVFF